MLWSTRQKLPTHLQQTPPAPKYPRPHPAGRFPPPTTTITILPACPRLPFTAASDPELNHTACRPLPRPFMTLQRQPITGQLRDHYHCTATERTNWCQPNNFHQKMRSMKNSPPQSQTCPTSVHLVASGLTVVFRSPEDPEILLLSGADWRDEPVQLD